MGLALLYMTVLGLDNITLGYMMVQGVPESVLGLITAAAGLSGILGAWAYPRIRRHVMITR